MLELNKILDASHILITTDDNSFANANALYSYILTLHKKVSMHYVETIDSNLSFLPWFDKARSSKAVSAEYTLNATADTKALFLFFKENNIKINPKMATSLYAGILKRYNVFVSDDCDGTIFAISSELIALNAEYRAANEYMRNRVPLSYLRLKALLFKSMLLVDSATVAELYVSEGELQESGASMKDAYLLMNEALSLVNVNKVMLYEYDKNKRMLIKEIKK
ncbi:phosphoesterase [Sulfurimonas sp.]|jgi:bifunctional oligoribonuclease and PAP phosphatase NrnA|uniref:DHH family phosphoesterase n=1 Tax=Sulfurimonas sp. TaxID=2022749 RepID=UPI0025DD5A75|nr:phosphoesterase [Sulfurimonas sp.]MBT5934339.1 phosphoesterase [Sulfurimonas sp.]